MRIINKFYPPGSLSHRVLVRHSEDVARKALEIALKASHLAPDTDFIYEAAMLHDIGIFLTGAAKIGCRGKRPYICHGYLGRKLLEGEGLPRHALVAERHVGVGITVKDIVSQRLPLPRRDMTPQAVEEIIICFADKFFQKGAGKTRSVEEVRKSVGRHGAEKLERFDAWLRMFE